MDPHDVRTNGSQPPCDDSWVARASVKVILGDVLDLVVDLVVVPPGHPAAGSPGVVTVDAPRYRAANQDYLIAGAYRRALEEATRVNAGALGLTTSLSRGPWPLDSVTRVAMSVIASTPSSVRRVEIATPTAAGVEIWAEAIARERL